VPKVEREAVVVVTRGLHYGVYSRTATKAFALALTLFASSVLNGATLPPDSVDMMYHNYDGGA